MSRDNDTFSNEWYRRQFETVNHNYNDAMFRLRQSEDRLTAQQRQLEEWASLMDVLSSRMDELAARLDRASEAYKSLQETVAAKAGS